MKKKLLCIVIAFVMVLPLILTSCGDTRSEEDIKREIASGNIVALTLSVWLPTNAEDVSEDSAFDQRLQEIEAEINKILLDKNYVTKLELIAVNEAEYIEKLQDRFNSMDEAIEESGNTASFTASRYQNEAEKVYYGDTYIYELKYRNVLDTQLDIFLVQGYENYINYYENGYLYQLDEFIRDDAIYSNVKRLIRQAIWDQIAIDNKIYAIPNNHLYADTYQYILVDKTVYEQSQDYHIDISDDHAPVSSTLSFDELDISALAAYLRYVGLCEIDGVVPFVATLDDAPGVVYANKDCLIGNSVTANDISSIYDLESYVEYVNLYKELNDASWVQAELNDGQTAAVKVMYGTKEDAEALSDNYYVIKATAPIAESESVYSSMFAISSYSANYARAMRVLSLLQRDTEVITLLQYGIKGEDYTVDYNQSTGKYVFNINESSAYANAMTLGNTGNPYYTYPCDEYEMSTNNIENENAWQDVKDVNLDVIPNPYINFEYFLNSDALTDEEKAELSEAIASAQGVAENIEANVSNMTLAEFEEFIELYNLDYSQVTTLLEQQATQLEAMRADIARIEEEIASEENEEAISAKQEQINEINERIAELEPEYNANLAIKASYDENATIQLIKGEEYSALVELYETYYARYN